MVIRGGGRCRRILAGQEPPDRLLLFELLRHFTSAGRAAILAAIFAVATPNWTIASQALWQHGPSMLVLVLAFRLVLVGRPGPAAAALAGALVALVATIRPPNLLLTFPLAVIALYAFNSRRTLKWPIPGLTFEWFDKAFHNPGVREALWTSVKAATGATLIALLLGTLASLAVAP